MAAGVGTAMTARAYHGVAGWRSSMARGAVWPKQGQPAVGDCRRCSTPGLPCSAAPGSCHQQQRQCEHLLCTPRHPHRPRGPAAAAQPRPPGFGSMHWRGMITYSVGSQERGEANCGIWRHITQ
uniref:Uncharacterized protein n=1 Tax=Oryza rufipogon TaxID=4529 RepID=A0A0E0RG90_ORYRU